MTANSFLERVGGLTIYRNTYHHNDKGWTLRRGPSNEGLHATPSNGQDLYGHYVSKAYRPLCK